MTANTNANYVDAQLEHYQQPPNNYVGLWHLLGCKDSLGERRSFKERIAIRLTHWVIAALMRDPKVRKMFCLAISTELRRMQVWLDEAQKQPPPARND